MGTPAYTRLENDERRRRLLELGTRLFTEHAYEEISMARIAREAGVSKALLYHYFPSKRQLHGHARAVDEALRMRVRARSSAAAERQALATALDGAWPGYKDNATAYAKLFRSASGRARGARAGRGRARGDGRADPRRPRRRGTTPAREPRSTAGCGSWTGRAWTRSPTAVLSHAELHGLLLGTLAGALVAAGVTLPDA